MLDVVEVRHRDPRSCSQDSQGEASIDPKLTDACSQRHCVHADEAKAFLGQFLGSTRRIRSERIRCERMSTNESISASLDDYVPTHVDAGTWDAVAGLVREAVMASTRRGSTAQRYRSHTAAFAAWGHANGCTADLANLFDLDTIERYIAVGMPSAADSTRATRRSILRRIARHASPALNHLPAPAPLPYRRVRAPYSRDEIEGHFRLVRAQPTKGRERSLSAVLNLGLGCGLDCRDLGWVRGIDVTRDQDGTVTVNVCGGSRPRTVVCLAAHEDHIWELAQGCGERLMIGGKVLGRHNVTSVSLADLITDSTLPRLVPSRLRSTWMLTHMQLGTPLPIFMPAAGLTTVRPLEDLLHHLPDADSEVAAARMRGSA